MEVPNLKDMDKGNKFASPSKKKKKKNLAKKEKEKEFTWERDRVKK